MKPDMKPLVPPMLVADHLALDFLNSVATLDEGPVEWIGNGSDLLSWLRAAGAISIDHESFTRRKIDAPALDDAAQDARELREWFRAIVRRNAGRSAVEIKTGQLDVINRLLEHGQTYLQVNRLNASALCLNKQRRWTDARQLLQPLAEAIGDLLCNADWQLVRACGGKNCTLFFLDKTKAHRRRWCSMAICGNRHKVATHRARVLEGE
jgi:predicted RNA-binding Zn ribbon-like protein